MKKTHWIILSILWAALTWRLTSTPQVIVLDQPWFHSLMMMSAHFIFFGIQAVLLFLSSLRMGNSIALSSIFGALIEFNQASIPGRTADPLDWILDTLGALAFLLVLKKLQSSHT